MQRQPRTSSKRRGALIALALLVVVAVVLAILELTNTTHLFHHQAKPVSASQATKGESASSGTANGASPTPTTGNTKSNSGGDSSTPNQSADLLAPSGNFVSNHKPNLSGSPAPNTMSSVCSTTPGASCKITFTKDGVTKALPAQTVDAGGSTIWSWKLQDVGLTAGSWSVQAVATLGSQTKMATDPLTLDVSP